MRRALFLIFVAVGSGALGSRNGLAQGVVAGVAPATETPETGLRTPQGVPPNGLVRPENTKVPEPEFRDPFQKPLAEAKDVSKALPNVKVTPKAELEKFAVDQFKVLAILTGLNQNRAMVSVGGGKIFYITEKTKLGMRNGVVRKITPDSVLIREKFVNLAGFDEVVDTELKLDDPSAKKASDSGGYSSGMPGGYSPSFPSPYSAPYSGPNSAPYPAPYPEGVR